MYWVTYIISANCLVKDAVIIIAAVAKQFAFLSKLSTTLYMEMVSTQLHFDWLILNFADSVVMFCDFYRAQAWYRWMRSNGSAKSSMKFLLQQVTHAASYPDFIERCNALNESPDYSEKARDWFMKHWLSHQQVWIGGAYKPSNTLGRGTDGSSCGVLVCKFAQNIIEGKPLEVPNIMAARKEIVTMLLDYTDLTMLDEYCTYCCCMEDDGEGVIEWVDCVVCGRWFHATCLKSAAREMGLIRNNSEDWRCKICRSPK
ncbi:hypothetical protein CAPTEDRAFT_189938 [Capitella teleta]|uniref:PHD-type domain-containing protein n=1 Tax=Capitella teleta TaxID=283909 RepID=R7URZ7_CAPTE|nr:hypothetical protein CAPTEDRAFT_189938 [Capitella teleta]|eukprot:ELU08970.1 hypothetical protein CAPTEDRAFT_189938 [Capitella teleta]